MRDNGLVAFTPFYYDDEKPGMQYVGYQEAKHMKHLDYLPCDYWAEE